MFDCISKHPEESWKYNAKESISDEHWGVWKCGQTLSWVSDTSTKAKLKMRKKERNKMVKIIHINPVSSYIFIYCLKNLKQNGNLVWNVILRPFFLMSFSFSVQIQVSSMCEQHSGSPSPWRCRLQCKSVTVESLCRSEGTGRHNVKGGLVKWCHICFSPKITWQTVRPLIKCKNMPLFTTYGLSQKQTIWVSKLIPVQAVYCRSIVTY